MNHPTCLTQWCPRIRILSEELPRARKQTRSTVPRVFSSFSLFKNRLSGLTPVGAHRPAGGLLPGKRDAPAGGAQAAAGADGNQLGGRCGGGGATRGRGAQLPSRPRGSLSACLRLPRAAGAADLPPPPGGCLRDPAAALLRGPSCLHPRSVVVRRGPTGDPRPSTRISDPVALWVPWVLQGWRLEVTVVLGPNGLHRNPRGDTCSWQGKNSRVRWLLCRAPNALPRRPNPGVDRLLIAHGFLSSELP